MKTFLSFLGGAALAAGLLGALVLHLPLALLGTLALGFACLGWLVVIVVLPWNLYFQARQVLFEMRRSRERHLEVSAEQEEATRRVERRMLRLSVGLHVASAALVALGSWLAHEPWGSAFAALFVLSTFFRPGVEYYRYLKALLSDALTEVKFPRDDVARLVAQVEHDAVRVEALRQGQERLSAALEKLEHDSVARSTDAHRRLESVARKFDEALDKLTDNREVISGLKAFLRLVREPNSAG